MARDKSALLEIEPGSLKTLEDWQKLRSVVKGHSVGTRLRKFVGRGYNEDGGALSDVNRLLSAYYSTERYDVDQLPELYETIKTVVAGGKRSKYALLLGSLVVGLPNRGEGSPRGQELMERVASFSDPTSAATPSLSEVSRLSAETLAHRAFFPHIWAKRFPTTVRGRGVQATLREVRWKDGALRSMADMAHEGFETVKAVTSGGELPTGLIGQAKARATEERSGIMDEDLEAELREDVEEYYGAIAPELGRPEGHERVGQSVSGDVKSTLVKGVPAATVNAVLSGADVGVQLGMEDGAKILDTVSKDAIGTGFAIIDLVQGTAKLVKAAIAAFDYTFMKRSMSIVPFGAPSASVMGILTLLERHGKESAAAGAASLASGVTSLALTGVTGGAAAVADPVVGLASAAVQLFIAGMAMRRDYKEARRAQGLLDDDQHLRWLTPGYAQVAISQSPLLGAYLVQPGVCETSALLQSLCRDDDEAAELIRDGPRDLVKQVERMRRIGNQCQERATWGVAGMPGFQQMLDGRQWKQALLFQRNMARTFVSGGADGLKKRIDFETNRMNAILADDAVDLP